MVDVHIVGTVPAERIHSSAADSECCGSSLSVVMIGEACYMAVAGTWYTAKFNQLKLYQK